jgi:hypothetical protein
VTIAGADHRNAVRRRASEKCEPISCVRVYRTRSGALEGEVACVASVARLNRAFFHVDITIYHLEIGKGPIVKQLLAVSRSLIHARNCGMRRSTSAYPRKDTSAALAAGTLTMIS